MFTCPKGQKTFFHNKGRVVKTLFLEEHQIQSLMSPACELAPI